MGPVELEFGFEESSAAASKTTSDEPFSLHKCVCICMSKSPANHLGKKEGLSATCSLYFEVGL